MSDRFFFGKHALTISRRDSFLPRKLRGSATIDLSLAIPELLSTPVRKSALGTWVALAGLRIYTNNLLTLVSSWIDWMARASSGATESVRIFSHRRASSDRGIEFVSTTS